jgi:hypothetical protein
MRVKDDIAAKVQSRRKLVLRKQKSRLKGSFLGISGGPDGARTRDLRRDRPAF